jgi:adenylate cyclase
MNQSAKIVFLSYASEDASVADAVCGALERAGVDCWIAPRDVVPGEFYADAIVRAIDASNVLVLILSRSAASSPHVVREVERAASKRHPVVSFRIDLAPMPPALEYFLNTSHWLDTSAVGVAAALPKLVDAVRRLLVPITARTDSPHIPAPGAQSGASADPVHIEANCIAVLPFADMSEKGDQEFFSDGLSEEITAALSKVRDLHVVGRTSAFQFKGRSEDLRSIGRSLNAAHLIEGSVRKAGERVRIAAQLISADSGLRLWAETYDRQLTDIFQIQEDIARAIAEALRGPLGLSPGELLVPNRSVDLQAYDDYLRAGARMHMHPDEAIALLEAVVARDPRFAPAWGLLGYAYNLQTYLSPVVRSAVGRCSVREAREIIHAIKGKADQAARQAILLDPRHAGGHATLAHLEFWRGNWSGAERLFQKALAIDADHPHANHEYAIMLVSSGYFEEGLKIIHRLTELEPRVAVYGVAAALFTLLTGRISEAISIAEATRPDASNSGFWRACALSTAYATMGRYAEAADQLLDMAADAQISEDAARTAAQILRRAPAVVASPQALPRFYSELNIVYPFVGADERALEYWEFQQQSGMMACTFLPWLPPFLRIRNTDRFKRYIRSAGLIDYWRGKGWPTMCRPVGEDDFIFETKSDNAPATPDSAGR